MGVGVDFMNKIGRAIIEAKVFLCLLSSSTATSKFCQDELALAYVCGKPIFPVALQSEEDILAAMDTGMRLQLARYDWYSLVGKMNYHNLCDKLINAIKRSIRSELEEVKEEEDDDESSRGGNVEQEGKKVGKRVIKGRQLSRTRLGSSLGSRGKVAVVDRGAECNKSKNLNTFWIRNFQNEDEVTWNDFKNVFLKEYQVEIKGLIGDKHVSWMLNTLRRELKVRKNGDKVVRITYRDFCTSEEVLYPFWHRVQEQLVESWSMKEVFDMESTVRMDAIQSLGQFKSPAVVEALFDLLEDVDDNVRAIAAISLAKSGCTSKKESIKERLIQCLEDRDRLVRESTCIALGFLRDQDAVPHLLRIWRNDVISGVREAAVTAMREIGGTEAENAIHMTEVLMQEIYQLQEEVRIKAENST